MNQLAILAICSLIFQNCISRSEPYPPKYEESYGQPKHYESYSEKNKDYVHYLAKEYRSINGWDNNLKNPDWGMSWGPFLRISPACWLPTVNSRYVSNAMSSKELYYISPYQSKLFQAFGNFIVHDLSLIKSGKEKEKFDIEVINEPKFGESISMYRTDWLWNKKGWRDQINGQTSFLDMSQFYGQDVYVTEQIRTHYDGKLKSSGLHGVSHEQMSIPLHGSPHMNFYTADERTNENSGLLSITGLFILRHNKICDKIKEIFPDLGDDRTFEEAKRRVIAEYQSIIFNEYLPNLLGLDMGPYTGYDEYVNAGTSNEYSLHGGRYCHVLQYDDLTPLNDDLGEHYQGRIEDSHFAFQSKLYMTENLGITPIIIGLMWSSAQASSTKYPNSIRNNAHHQIDIAAMDYWRSEDHATSVYNCVRMGYGLSPVYSWTQITKDPLVQKMLYNTYKNPEIGHTQVLANAEDPYVKGYPLGETHSHIIYDQFQRARSGDRFWYEREFCNNELEEIQSLTLGQIIRETLYITSVTPYVLEAPPSPKHFFQGYGYKCSYNVLDYTPIDAIPVKAQWDAKQYKCVCPVQYSYFKSKINQCYCQYGYYWNEKKGECDVDKEKADYGDYREYHLPEYKMADLTNSNYNNHLSYENLHQKSNMDYAYNELNY